MKNVRLFLMLLLLCVSYGVHAGFFSPKIHGAAKKGDLTALRSLLETGEEVDATNAVGNTALMVASMEGQVDAVVLLIEAGANVNAATTSGDTALSFACWKGHGNIVRLLLEKRANVDTRGTGGRTPLMVAAKFDHIEIVEMLLDAGANAAPKDAAGKTATQLLITANSNERGANVSDRRKTVVRRMMAQAQHSTEAGSEHVAPVSRANSKVERTYALVSGKSLQTLAVEQAIEYVKRNTTGGEINDVQLNYIAKEELSRADRANGLTFRATTWIDYLFRRTATDRWSDGAMCVYVEVDAGNVITLEEFRADKNTCGGIADKGYMRSGNSESVRPR